MKTTKPEQSAPPSSSSVGRGVGVLLSRTRALSSSVSRWSRSATAERADADVAVLTTSATNTNSMRMSLYKGKQSTGKAKVRFASGWVELMNLVETRKLRNVRETKISELVEKENYVNELEFDNRNFSLDELQVTALLILERAAPGAAFAEKSALIALFEFVESVRAVYRANPYHDFRHAVDVMQFMNHLLSRDDVAQRVLGAGQGFPVSGDELKFTLLVACLCHDAGHDGTTNAFHRKTNSDLIDKFGPESTLERLHVHLAETLIEKSSMWEVIKPYMTMDLTQFLQEIRSLIFATDMEKHGALLSTFKASPSSQLLNMLIKISDISNVTRNFEEAKVWTKRLDAEVKLAASKLPPSEAPAAPPSLAQSVIGFSKVFALPLIDALSDAGLQDTGRELRSRVESNIANWERFQGDSINPGL